MGKTALGIAIVDGKLKMNLEIREGTVQELSMLVSYMEITKDKIKNKIEKMSDVGELQ